MWVCEKGLVRLYVEMCFRIKNMEFINIPGAEIRRGKYGECECCFRGKKNDIGKFMNSLLQKLADMKNVAHLKFHEFKKEIAPGAV